LPISLIFLLFAVRERVSKALLAIPLAFLVLNIGPFIAKAGWSAYLQTKHLKEALDSVEQMTPQRLVKISQPERSVNYSLYLEHLLRTRGIRVVYSLCGGNDKQLPYFTPFLCIHS
jgi:hypothetical protein